jgi:hypothetical protein
MGDRAVGAVALLPGPIEVQLAGLDLSDASMARVIAA